MQISDLLCRMPRDLLLLLKTNDCLRAVDGALVRRGVVCDMPYAKWLRPWFACSSVRANSHIPALYPLPPFVVPTHAPTQFRSVI